MRSELLLFLFIQVSVASCLNRTDTCRHNVELELAAYLTSAGYPISYPPSQQCVWVITALKPSQKISITFNTYFDLEGRDCRNDYVEVYDGGDELSPLLGRFCGSVAPPSIASNGNQALIKFVSDNETQGSGFSVQLKAFQIDTGCSRNFTAPQGVVKSPGFPKKYPNYLNCTFMIFAPNTSEIVVEFDSFDLEPDALLSPSSVCRSDWLDIWDGPPAVGSYIGKYCGQTSPGRMISDAGILSMVFTTDSSIGREGFSANYTVRQRSLPSGHDDEGGQSD